MKHFLDCPAIVKGKGPALRQARLEAGLSQETLAAILNVGRRAVIRLEAGRPLKRYEWLGLEKTFANLKATAKRMRKKSRVQ